MVSLGIAANAAYKLVAFPYAEHGHGFYILINEQRVINQVAKNVEFGHVYV